MIAPAVPMMSPYFGPKFRKRRFQMIDDIYRACLALEWVKDIRMKRRFRHRVQIGMLLALFAFRSTAIAEQPPDSGAWLRFIGLEVRQLRVELFEHRLESEAEKITVLERDLAATRSERAALQAEESVHRQQVANLDAQLAEAGVEPEARAQMEASKAELAGRATERLRTAQNTLGAREAEINERIRLAKAHLQTLATRMKQLAFAASQ